MASGTVSTGKGGDRGSNRGKLRLETSTNPDESGLGTPRGLAQTLRALRHRNYRLFFFGQGVSVIGTWMQGVTLGWLVYVITASPAWLGIVGFASQALTFVLSPFAGVLADRLNRHRLIMITQTLAMIQAAILAALTLTGVIQVWHILVLGVALGVISAFDIPIRQSFVVEMVGRREDLPNAIALNSFVVNGGRIIGPSIAGVLIAALSGYDPEALQSAGGAASKGARHLGEGVCFLLNAVSYLAVLVALRAMRVAPRVNNQPRRHVLHELHEGFKYAFGFAPIRTVLLLVGLISIVGAAYSVLLPVYTREQLGGHARTYGFLMSAGGAGAMVGALFLASRRSVVGLGRVMAIGSALFGLTLIGLSLSRVLGLSTALLVLTGFGFMIQMASGNTILQTIVDDDKRGRIMSFYVIAFMGMAPFGSLIGGLAAEAFGVPCVLIVGGVCSLLGAVAFALRLPAMRRMVRPIYVKMGLLPTDQ